MARTKSRSKGSQHINEQPHSHSADDSHFDLTDQKSSTTMSEQRNDGKARLRSHKKQQQAVQPSPSEQSLTDGDERQKRSLQGDAEMGLSATDRATSQLVTNWVKSNYEYEHEHNVPRSGMYEHYKSYCQTHAMEPVNSATFGKLIRTVFPGIKTRRLGTRGQSKYHYCNIRLRSSYQSPSGTLALARPFASEEVPKTTEDNTCQLVPASDNLTYDILEDTSSGHSNLTGLEGASLLVIATDFPAEANIPSTHPTIPNYSTSPSTNLVLPSLKQISSEVQSKASYNRVRSVGQYDLPTFITPPLRYSHPYEQAELGVSFTTVYEQHCRELLSLIVREQFVHVDRCMSQFYQEMHEDYKKLLRNVPDMVETVWRWDSALYDTIIVQTFPSIAAPMPTKMHQGLSQFSYGLIQRLEFYLEGFSRHLYQRKTEVARIFASKLNRHLSLNRMAQATSTVLSQPDAVDRLRIDWEGMDFGNVADQGLWTCDCNTAEIQKILREQILSLLRSRASLEDWMAWTEHMMDKYMNRQVTGQNVAYDHRLEQAKQMILKWTFYTSLLIRDFTLRDAPSVAYLRTLCLFFDDFFLYMIEERIARMNVAFMRSNRAETEIESRDISHTSTSVEAVDTSYIHDRRLSEPSVNASNLSSLDKHHEEMT